MWELFRPDIHQYVKNEELWFDPNSGARLDRCPWLIQVPESQVYHCEIYEDRPEDCRHYPSRIDEMIRDQCQMIEVKDIENLKHAQRDLDKIMASSRPSVDRRE